jgi:hypothetical protein
MMPPRMGKCLTTWSTDEDGFVGQGPGCSVVGVATGGGPSSGSTAAPSPSAAHADTDGAAAAGGHVPSGVRPDGRRAACGNRQQRQRTS